MEVGRSLEQIDQKVRKLNESIKQTTSQTREFDKALKLDPKNTEASIQKMKNLEVQIGLATQKVSLLKQKQIEANNAFKNGDLTAKEFNKIQVAVLQGLENLKKASIMLIRH